MLRKNEHRGISRLSIAARLRRDAGSTMVTVLIVMLVLTIGGLALSAIAMNTAVSVTGTRDRSAAQAEVDGAIATKTVELMTGRQSCSTTGELNGKVHNGPVATTPEVTWTLKCSVSGTVGKAVLEASASVGGEVAKKQSVFSYEATPPPPSYGDMTFFGTPVVTFTTEVHPGSPGKPMTLVLPKTGFICQGEIWGSVVASGDIRINGPGCQVHGSLTSVNGVIYGNQADAKIDGDITTGGTGTNVVFGTVGGNVHTKGSVSFSESSRTISGSVVSGGNVALKKSNVVGSITMRGSSSFTSAGGTHGGLIKLAMVPDPQLPNLPPWFEFQYKPSEWPTFTNVITLSSSLPKENPLSCEYYNSWPQKGWTDLNSITQKTVLDARACSKLSTNAGTSPVIKLPQDLLMLAKAFDTTSSSWSAASGLSEKPSVWFVTEDPNPADNAPTCSGGLGEVKLNHVGTTTSIKAMVYTPCKINIAGNSTFNGQLYGAGWDHGGGINFLPDTVGLPGMSTSSGGSQPGGVPQAGSFVLQTSQDVPASVTQP
ncbi:MAG: hypothetical protein LCH31_06445 [Actinobacteria bacterium]|nr:hypothetical protein [Actinomycetota bacterium]